MEMIYILIIKINKTGLESSTNFIAVHSEEDLIYALKNVLSMIPNEQRQYITFDKAKGTIDEFKSLSVDDGPVETREEVDKAIKDFIKSRLPLN